MKKILLALLFAPMIAHAGTITINQNLGSSLGTIVISTFTGVSSPPGGLGFLHMLRGPSSVNANQTLYSAMGTGDLEVTVSTTNETVMRGPYWTPGVASKFWIKVISNSMSATSTATVRVNGASSTLLIPIAAGVTGELTDATHSVSFSANDKIDVAIIGSTGTGTIALYNADFVYTPTTNNMMKFIAMTNGNQTSANGFAKYYISLSGAEQLSDQTETDGPQMVMPLAGTLENMCISVGTNTLNAVQTLTLRHNGADGNETISIPANFSGILCDTATAHYDFIVAGDTVNYSYNMGNTGNTGVTGVWWISTEFVTVGNATVYVAQNRNHSPAANTTLYGALTGALSWDVESAIRTLSQVPGTFSHMAIHVPANANTHIVPITFRKNGAQGSETITVPVGATGYYVANSTQTDHVTATDEINTILSTDANNFEVDYYNWIFTHD